MSAWVVAEPGTRLLLIDAHTFFSELLPLPQVARNLLRLMAARMRQANNQVVEQVRRSLVLERLQSELRTAQEIHGVTDITSGQMRDGMEQLEITEEKMAALGLPSRHS